jgi:multicomponent Na+:H+ antiporter subunit D
MAAKTDAAVDISVAMVTAPVTPADWLVVAPVALSVLVGAFLLMTRHVTRLQAGIAIASLGVVLALNIALLVRVATEGPVVMTMGRWLPPFGITFVADLLGAGLAATGALVALAGAVFATADIDTTGRRYGFYPFLMLLVAGVQGAFLTGDVFNLYVWFEVFLISSFGLIVLGSEKPQLDGGTKYAVLNLVGTTFFLIGTGYLYGMFGTLNMADIARKMQAADETRPLLTLTSLYLLAFAMKAAAFPVNFWLPASYHTPRIVVAALFGGLLTKVGIYALMRILVMLFPDQQTVMSGLIGALAMATMLLGIFGALAQSDIRRILGFVVISGIGIMLAGVALGGVRGLSGAIIYAVHSMIVMTALYLMAGLMRDRGGSYDLHSLAGLYRASPLLAALMLFLVLALAGLPPGSGLWPKVVLVQAALEQEAWMMAFVILLTGLLTTLALGRVFALAFWRDRPQEGAIAADVQGTLRAGYGTLAALCLPLLVLGLYPDPLIGLADRAAAGLLDPSAYVESVFPAEAVR